jgi:glutamine amidotransferase
MIKVVNFPFCNYFSLERYFRIRALPCQALETYEQLRPADIIVLPGVGTFRQGMDFLVSMQLAKLIRDHAEADGKLVGICLGMQMLLQSSTESPGIEGLGLIPGSCEHIPENSSFSVPHIGWNEIKITDNQDNILAPFRCPSGSSKSDFYFVHSYYAKPLKSDSVIASFEHPLGMLPAAIASGNCIGFQFHPEKSGSAGYDLLDRVFII